MQGRCEGKYVRELEKNYLRRKPGIVIGSGQFKFSQGYIVRDNRSDLQESKILTLDIIIFNSTIDYILM